MAEPRTTRDDMNPTNRLSQTTEEGAAWLIWSGEHKAWWRPNAKGYSEFIGGAGRYTRSEVLAWLYHAGPEKELHAVAAPYGPCALETDIHGR